jgi:hypothetical protein
MNDRGIQPGERFMLWVDGVGGFWVCLADVVTLGQPVPERVADVPILGDLAGRHARIRRDGEGYLVESIRAVCVDGRPVAGVAPLVDGSCLELGARVRLAFRRPHALSATARLDFLSAHRTAPPADAVLLMADSCVLGPAAHCHVVCRDWPQEVVLYRQDDGLYCRAGATIQIDGRACGNRGPVTLASRVAGEGFSMTLEKIR